MSSFLLSLRLQSVLTSSMATLNQYETVLDTDLRERLFSVSYRPRWGKGLCQYPLKGEWKKYLFGFKNAMENLNEIRNILGLETPAECMSIEQVAEGVRRVLCMTHAGLPALTDKYWSQEQATTIAKALVDDCGIQKLSETGGLEECCKEGLIESLPRDMPGWLKFAQKAGIAAMRPVFLGLWSWQSRFVETPFGKIHVYDSCAPDRVSTVSKPPLLLQHGMFVSGWSMALLGYLLCRRGRRVVIVDLFDYDNGLSASHRREKGQPVRRVHEKLKCIECVIQDLVDGGAKEVDVAGHSFGGFLISRLAWMCETEGLPLRKVVMIAPGGPFIDHHHNPAMTRILNEPMDFIEQVLPWWFPAAPIKAATRVVLGVFLSANNSNMLVGLLYKEYLGSQQIGTLNPTLLLWGDRDELAKPRQPEPLARYLSHIFPRLDAYWVKGGGHNIQIDSASAVARAMDAWLDSGDINASLKTDLADVVLFPTRAKLERMDLTVKLSPPIESKL